jgi:hypothetical protein
MIVDQGWRSVLRSMQLDWLMVGLAIVAIVVNLLTKDYAVSALWVCLLAAQLLNGVAKRYHQQDRPLLRVLPVIRWMFIVVALTGFVVQLFFLIARGW